MIVNGRARGNETVSLALVQKRMCFVFCGTYEHAVTFS